MELICLFCDRLIITVNGNQNIPVDLKDRVCPACYKETKNRADVCKKDKK